MSDLRYFTYDEFDSPDLPKSGYMYMDRDFVKRVDMARDIAGVPFKINSGYRTHNHNIRVGGSPNSSHKKGLACDISTPDSRTKYKVLKSLIEVGFTRIGVYDSFIHVDDDKEKIQEVVW